MVLLDDGYLTPVSSKFCRFNPFTVVGHFTAVLREINTALDEI